MFYLIARAVERDYSIEKLDTSVVVLPSALNSFESFLDQADVAPVNARRGCLLADFIPARFWHHNPRTVFPQVLGNEINAEYQIGYEFPWWSQPHRIAVSASGLAKTPSHGPRGIRV